MISIQLVVFDIAGTTVAGHHEVHRALRQALAHEGFNVSYNEANAVMGYPKPVAIRQLLEKRGAAEATDAYVDQIHQDFVERMVDHYANGTEVSEKEGVQEVWSVLRQRKIRVALDTGFSRPIADAIIGRLGWRNLIDASVTSDEVERGRPHPDMIFRAMERTGVSNGQAVAKVGDTASDLQQGTAAGCGLVVGVTTGAYSAEELQREPHTHLIARLPELLSILEIED
jgi:phosphonatase-like hydrolase